MGSCDAVGVFAGYRLRPGSHWSEEYLVWDISDFASFALSDVASSLSLQLRRPHVTGRVSLHMDIVSFPLKAAYDEANTTLQGICRPIEARGARSGFGETQPRLAGFLERISARPAYRRALERGGPYAFAR